MIDDDGKRDARKGGVVMRLRIDHRKMRIEVFQLVGQRKHGDAQIPDHRQIVRPRNFIDPGNGDFPGTMGHDPLEGHSRRHRVGIGIDHDEPVVIAVE